MNRLYLLLLCVGCNSPKADPWPASLSLGVESIVFDETMPVAYMVSRIDIPPNMQQYIQSSYYEVTFNFEAPSGYDGNFSIYPLTEEWDEMTLPPPGVPQEVIGVFEPVDAVTDITFVIDDVPTNENFFTLLYAEGTGWVFGDLLTTATLMVDSTIESIEMEYGVNTYAYNSQPTEDLE